MVNICLLNQKWGCKISWFSQQTLAVIWFNQRQWWNTYSIDDMGYSHGLPLESQQCGQSPCIFTARGFNR
jgi:hypothetical protein